MMIGIDTCHRLIEDRTVQELMDSYRDEVERSEQGKPMDYIEQRWRAYVKDELSNRHVQVFTKYVYVIILFFDVLRSLVGCLRFFEKQW